MPSPVIHRDISRVLEVVGDNKILAARILGCDRKALYRKLAHAGRQDPQPG